ncbi:uncharacterized protein BT62DRAFT_884722, partial [Guyanagaster necrorhizus]
VSSDYIDWTFTQFYNELFNWYFSRDYHIDRKIAKCFQGSRHVQDYTFELQSQFKMLRDESECT